MEIEMPRRSTITNHAVNVVDAMLKDERALMSRVFFNDLDKVLRRHGFRISPAQFGTRGLVISVVPYEEQDDGE
jgi:hypothetical protein